MKKQNLEKTKKWRVSVVRKLRAERMCREVRQEEKDR